MKILIKSGATEHTLCHGHLTGLDKHVGPSDLLVAGPVTPEVATFIRSTDAVVYNRANRQTSISFSVTRECASPLAAELFCFTHLRDTLRSDTLILLAQGASGSISQVTLSNAVLADIQCRQIGLSVLIAYQILGGTLT